jgi:DNA-binding NarL/FixJ family response regulator
MRTSNIIPFEGIPLLEMDQVQLVQIYAQKLTLLTKKQRVIFDLLSSGMMVKDIAKHLELAEITVKVVKARVMVILGVTTLQEMAVISKCTSCTHLKQDL